MPKHYKHTVFSAALFLSLAACASQSTDDSATETTEEIVVTGVQAEPSVTPPPPPPPPRAMKAARMEKYVYRRINSGNGGARTTNLRGTTRRS